MGDMDSENSGSMQTSSTGDEQEYESSSVLGSHDSISALFNTSGSGYPVTSVPLLQLYSLNTPTPLDHHHQYNDNDNQHQSCFANPTNPNLMVNSSNNNSSIDIGGWPDIRAAPSEATNPGYMSFSNSTTNPAPPPPPPPFPVQLQPTNNQEQQHTTAGRNPKKRSRASRRAPTTVLTTDTTNFRQMVQEFTGIPSPPFSASGFPTRPRLDLHLFGGLGMGFHPTRIPNTTPATTLDIVSSSAYPLRPKVLPHQLLLQRMDNTNSPTAQTSTTTSAQPRTKFLPNFNNPFQSLLQQSSLLPLIPPDSSFHHLNPPKATTSSNTPTPLGFMSPHATPKDLSFRINPPNWAAPFQGLGHLVLDQETAPNYTNTLAGPSSHAHTQRPPPITTLPSLEDRVSTRPRGEGLVDSWICSSDIPS